jgi:hypothetical protein
MSTTIQPCGRRSIVSVVMVSRQRSERFIPPVIMSHAAKSRIAIPLSPNFTASSAASYRFPYASQRSNWETSLRKSACKYLICLVSALGLEPRTP